MNKRLVNNRVFTDHGDYFTIVEESTWEGKYNPETKSLESGNPSGWTKTHIIIQQVAGGGNWGMQILRFHRDSANGEWELANNPYAGVYLNSDEWSKVCNRGLVNG